MDRRTSDAGRGRERWLHLVALVPAYCLLVPLSLFGAVAGLSLSLDALVGRRAGSGPFLLALVGVHGVLCLAVLARTVLEWVTDAQAARRQLRQVLYFVASGTVLSALLLATGLVHGAWGRLLEDALWVYAYVAPAVVGWRQVLRLRRLASTSQPQPG